MKKTVLITGASGNLGKAVVEKFVTEGYSVITTVSPGKKVAIPGVAGSVEVSLSDEGSVAQAFQKIIDQHKTIDAALLLAGGFSAGSIGTTDSSALKKMFSTNFDTAYFISRLIFQQMLSQKTGGRIVFVGSRSALKASEGMHAVAYALSKTLIFKLSELLNAEGAAHNVVTSVVVPSIIDTPVNRESMPKADFSKWVRAEEIAEVMAFITGGRGNVLRDPVVKVYGKA